MPRVLCPWLPLLMLSSLLVGCATAGKHSGDAGVRVERGLVYVTRSEGGAQRADLYLPPGTAGERRPAVVVVHGGGWIRGEPSQMQRIVDVLVAQGYVVLNIGYRLAPQYPYPAAVDDLRAALRWIDANAERYGVDRRQIALWGYSAGAHLAGLVATVPDAQTPPIAAAILGGMPADLVRAQTSGLVQQFLGGTIAQFPQRYVEASPLTQITAQSAPMLLYHGSWDWIVDPAYSRDMYWHLRAAGVDSEWIELGGRGHFAAFFFDGRAQKAAFAFLDRHFAAAVR